MKTNTGKRGQTLVMVLVIMAVGVLIFTPLFNMGKQSGLMPQRWHSYDQCFLSAVSSMEKAKWDLYNNFLTYYTAAPLPQNMMKFTWFDTYTTNSIGPGGSNGMYSAPQGSLYSNATVAVTIQSVQSTALGGRSVVLHVKSSLNGIVREFEEVVLFQRITAGVFNYSYFINNFGWFWGDTIYAEGDIRANGNFSFGGYHPQVDGDVTAAINPQNGPTGIIDGNSPSHRQILNGDYYANAPATARPGTPTAITSTVPQPTGPSWPMGYNGDPQEYPYSPALAMPYLGDLSDYTWLASNKNGMVWQVNPVTFVTNVLISNVYSAAGPSGILTNHDGTPYADRGCLFLDGTVSNLHISGPVVVTGDVIIKGNFTGQGSIYAGRNMYIAGDIKSVNPASWPKPDTQPDVTAASNGAKDMLGLCAKGCTLMGDYTDPTWQSYVNMYSQPGFTEAYIIDPSDVVNGYGSYQDGSGNWWFNGNYTAQDGGQSVSGSGTTPRTFITSSVDAAKFKAFVSSSMVNEIDAVTFNNHLLTGLVGNGPSGITFNGSIVSRDEAIIYYNQVHMNWDIRLGTTSKDATAIDIYLPETVGSPQTTHFKEL